MTKVFGMEPPQIPQKAHSYKKEPADQEQKTADQDQKSADQDQISAEQVAQDQISADQEPSAKRIKLEEDVSKEKKNVNLSKLATKNVPAERAPSYLGVHGTRLTDFQGTVNRFTIVGPQRYAVLARVCVPAAIKPMNAGQTQPQEGMEDLMWWKSYYSSEKFCQDFAAEKERFEQACRGPPGTVLGNMALTVR